MATQSLSDITLSPSEVRDILNADNEEIISLCKRASIVPKRNRRGLTYFSYNDVKRLQEAKNMKSSLVRITPNAVVDRIMSSFSQMEEKISNNILDTLDKKLEEKMQGVEGMAAELIRVQTENEKLKNKIIELNRENVHMKMELEKFEKIGFGFYKKYEVKDYTI